jgi:signal transduction histidine kinase
MRFRKSRVRTKVTALLLSLAALWAFAAWVTLREGLNLVWVAVYDRAVATPSETLLVELQQERRLSAVLLGNPAAMDRGVLTAQRTRTDAAAADFRRLARGSEVQFAADDLLKRRINELIADVDDLGRARQLIDHRQMDRNKSFETFTGVIDSIYRTYDALATLDDKDIAKDTRNLIDLSRARELLSQEDGLLAGSLAAGRIGPSERARFTQVVGAQRFHSTEAVAGLPQDDQAAYEKLMQSQSFTRLRSLEESVMGGGGLGAVPAVAAEQWKAATQPSLAAFQNLILEAGDRVVERTTPVAVGVIVRLVLAGVLGLVAVVASIVLSITTARALVRQLEKLRAAALDLANERLPGVVTRLAQGEKVDVAAEAPPLDFGGDLIGQVGAAFNTVQETAIRTAVEEAQLRQSIRDILLSLARRTQSLVHRQLTLLDVMERRESDPDDLKDLFRIDHLATRMRRNAENLIVMSGASPARAWRRSVPMVDVVRGALAEVEDYTRVTVLPMGQVGLTGRAVGDVIHLLAELIENAVSFSPPYTSVQVGGQIVASGYAIEIEDRGLGMSAEDLDATNERISNSPEFNLSSTARLGLYVVSRLAERHGIKVSLKASAYGGTTAVVLLPRELILEEGESLSAHDTGPFLQQAEQAERAEGAERRERAEQAEQAEQAESVERAEQAEQERGARKIALVGAPKVPEPAQEGVPVPGVPEVRPAPPASFTPSGLPFRVPQASLAPELAEEPQVRPDDEDDDDRSPEDVRKIMGAFQSGTRRGRSEAARLLRDGEDDDQ